MGLPLVKKTVEVALHPGRSGRPSLGVLTLSVALVLTGRRLLGSPRRGCNLDPGVCCSGCYCNWGNNGVASFIRDLGDLEGEFKNAGECRGYVRTQGFKSFGKEPIRAGSVMGVEGFVGSLGF